MTKAMLNHAPVVLALLLMAAGTVEMAGCGGGVCSGSGCGPTSMGSGHFVDGPFPNTALSLDGPRCYHDQATVGLFPFDGAVFTDPAVPAVVRTADALRVYWTVCNSGLVAAPGQSEAYSLSSTLRGPPDTPVTSDTYSIPPLAACTCDVESRVFQNELASGSYTFALSGAVTGSTDRNVNP